MVIDVSKFFDFDVADERIGYNGEPYYDVLLASKSTGEVITLTFDEAHFDELLKQMEENVKFLEDELNFVKEQKWWFL
jgi:hypothetical protein